MKSNNEIVQELGFELLSEDQIIKEGLEFTGEVCFSGEYGQQVCDKETEDGGQPVNGLLYEFRRNGALAYYAYYCEGFSHG